MKTFRAQHRAWFRSVVATVVTALVLTGTSVLAGAPAQAADVPPTVTTDVLPTVQINGVVWAQTTIGNTAYVTGRFTTARPAGAAPGTQETPRSNILAYDLTTGELITSFAASLNSDGYGITASPDGTRIYVVGNFTQADGQNRYRIAALDARTGALVPKFAAQVDYRARAVVAVGDTVYVGGQFSVANKTARSRLAAFRATDGSLLPWAPSADNEVFGLVAPGGTQVVAAGRFTTLNDEAHYGMGALDPVTGATRPWAATNVVRNAGSGSAIYSLATDGAQVYGTGYIYQANGSGNLEGSFGADAQTGTVKWVVGCAGDVYSVQPIGGVVYSVGHPHNCAPIGGWPQTDPWTYQRAMATTTDARRKNDGYTFSGKPAPQLLNWWPTLDVGSFTGQTQAAWSVTGNAQYLSLAGEFPKVNNVAQQGIVRMAVRALAPNLEGPRYQADFVPQLSTTATGAVRVRFRTTWDPETRDLEYRVVRDGETAAPVGSVTAASTWWNRPEAEFIDTGVEPGSTHTYRVYAYDPDGNPTNSTLASITVPVPQGPVVLSADAFGRTTTGGWGRAETGEAWTVSGGSANFSVSDGAGRVQVARNATLTAVLGRSFGDADVSSTATVADPPTAGGVVLTTMARRLNDSNDYRVVTRVISGRPVDVSLVRRVSGVQTTLGSVTLPGVTAAAGQALAVRFQVSGTGTTALRAKVWPAGTAEPAAWQLETTDTTAALQKPGGTALRAYLSSGAGTTSAKVAFDDFTVSEVPAQ